MIHILRFKENMSIVTEGAGSSVLISSIISGLIIHCYAKLNLGLQICKAIFTRVVVRNLYKISHQGGNHIIWGQSKI